MGKYDEYWSKNKLKIPKVKSKHFPSKVESNALVSYDEFEKLDSLYKVEFFLLHEDYAPLPQEKK